MPSIEALYVESGNSVNSDGSVRTIAGFARPGRDEPIWSDYATHFGDPTWLDSFVMSAIQGTGAFADESDLVRQKGIQNQVMVAWVFHEVVAALAKAGDGNFDPASGAPHNWDEGWAFYHGADPNCGGGNFGTGTAVNDALAAAFTKGVEALADGERLGRTGRRGRDRAADHDHLRAGEHPLRPRLRRRPRRRRRRRGARPRG